LLVPLCTRTSALEVWALSLSEHDVHALAPTPPRSGIYFLRLVQGAAHAERVIAARQNS
jgi:hypothetical protein